MKILWSIVFLASILTFSNISDARVRGSFRAIGKLLDSHRPQLIARHDIAKRSPPASIEGSLNPDIGGQSGSHGVEGSLDLDLESISESSSSAEDSNDVVDDISAAADKAHEAMSQAETIANKMSKMAGDVTNAASNAGEAISGLRIYVSNAGSKAFNNPIQTAMDFGDDAVDNAMHVAKNVQSVVQRTRHDVRSAVKSYLSLVYSMVKTAASGIMTVKVNIGAFGINRVIGVVKTIVNAQLAPLRLAETIISPLLWPIRKINTFLIYHVIYHFDFIFRPLDKVVSRIKFVVKLVVKHVASNILMILLRIPYLDELASGRIQNLYDKAKPQHSVDLSGHLDASGLLAGITGKMGLRSRRAVGNALSTSFARIPVSALQKLALNGVSRWFGASLANAEYVQLK